MRGQNTVTLLLLERIIRHNLIVIWGKRCSCTAYDCLNRYHRNIKSPLMGGTFVTSFGIFSIISHFRYSMRVIIPKASSHVCSPSRLATTSSGCISQTEQGNIRTSFVSRKLTSCILRRQKCTLVTAWFEIWNIWTLKSYEYFVPALLI